VCGIFNYEGSEENFHKLVALTDQARTAYYEMVRLMEKEVAEVRRITPGAYSGSLTSLLHLSGTHSRTPSACSAISFASSILSEPISENYPHSEPETDSRGYEIRHDENDDEGEDEDDNDDDDDAVAEVQAQCRRSSHSSTTSDKQVIVEILSHYEADDDADDEADDDDERPYAHPSGNNPHSAHASPDPRSSRASPDPRSSRASPNPRSSRTSPDHDRDTLASVTSRATITDSRQSSVVDLNHVDNFSQHSSKTLDGRTVDGRTVDGRTVDGRTVDGLTTEALSTHDDEGSGKVRCGTSCSAGRDQAGYVEQWVEETKQQLDLLTTSQSQDDVTNNAVVAMTSQESASKASSREAV